MYIHSVDQDDRLNGNKKIYIGKKRFFDELLSLLHPMASSVSQQINNYFNNNAIY